MQVDLGDLRFESGGALLVKRALRLAAAGEAVTVAGRQPDLAVHLRAWCRAEGHEFRSEDSGTGRTRILRGPAADQRWRGAERAGRSDPQESDAVLDQPSQRWGLAARGALVEAGSPEFHFALNHKVEIWSEMPAECTRRLPRRSGTRRRPCHGKRSSSFPPKWKTPSCR